MLCTVRVVAVWGSNLETCRVRRKGERDPFAMLYRSIVSFYRILALNIVLEQLL